MKGVVDVSKNKSLFFQFQSAIDESCFSKNFDKHAYKGRKDQCEQGWRVFSFSSRSNLLDMAHNLSKYIKEHHPDVKQVKHIKTEWVQDFLDAKARAESSVSTLNCYRSNLAKLSKIVNHHFGLHTSFEVKVKPELVTDKTTPREFALTTDEIDRIKQSITKPSNSSNFFVFSTFTATRVNQAETLRVCDLSLHYDTGQDKYLVKTRFLGDKGGRDREITTEGKEFYDFCRTLIGEKSGTDLLFGGIKKGSANAWLNRRMKKLQIYAQSTKCLGGKKILKSGNHSIRKSSIKAYYEKQFKHYLEQGFSKSRAIELSRGDVCCRLGHSRDRDDVANLYLGAAS